MNPQHEARETIDILIVDDHPVVSDGLKAYLETEYDFRVVDACCKGEQVSSKVEIHKPHIVLLDLLLEQSPMSGMEVARLLRTQYPHIKVVVLSAFSDAQNVLEVMGIGVDGYLLKTSNRTELIDTIKTVINGNSVFDPNVTEIVKQYLKSQPQKAPQQLLTRRQWEVLGLIAQDYSNEQIASELVIAIPTAKTHVTAIFKATGMKNRDQARVWYELNKTQELS